MSRLKRFSKKDTNIIHRPLRIDETLYYKFVKIASSYNLSVNEAIVKLIEMEVEEYEKEQSKSE